MSEVTKSRSRQVANSARDNQSEVGPVAGGNEAAADWASGFGGPPAGLTQGLRHVECAAGQLLLVDARAKAATLLNMD